MTLMFNGAIDLGGQVERLKNGDNALPLEQLGQCNQANCMNSAQYYCYVSEKNEASLVYCCQRPI